MRKKKIFLSAPYLFGNENKYLSECINSNWISSSGRFVDVFESSIAKYTGAKYAISCMNGTSALHLALKILDIRPGDEVLVPTLTFIAPVNSIIYNNLSPVFMDADEYFNLDVNKCISFINNETYYRSGYTYNKKTRKRISAILPVHVLGNAVYFDELVPLCKRRNIYIIEDASESLGTKYIKGKYNKKHTGTIGHLGCISFNGNKIVTSGSGGMILTNNSNFAKKAKYLSTQAKNNSLYSIHNNVGYNYRMSNIQAAVGLAQLENISIFLKLKLNIYKIYKEKIININGLSINSTPSYSLNNHWFKYIKN